MNKVSPLPKNTPAKNKNFGSQNFIEALKNQGKAASVGVAKTAIDQLFGADRPSEKKTDQENWQESWQIQEMLLKERQIQRRERLLIQQQRQSERLIFHQREEAAKKEIDVIKQEIKALVVQTGKLSTELIEAEKAVFGNTPDIKSGVYYLSFFERIKNLIIMAKKKVSESRTWLGLFNHRCQAKSYYWGQVAKSGSKFMLSHDRAVATSAG